VDQLSIGVVATPRKPDERRLAIHPAHLERIDADVRARMYLERGYGERFGLPDEHLAPLVAGLRSREELFADSDVLVLPKPAVEDLETLRPGQVVWGWPHCVQDRQMTQTAIDRGLTLIAWEAMNHWTDDGNFSVHVFHKNNELAGYCSVMHALQLLGSTGDYGRRLRAAVISFGATARGAVRALSALGISDVTVLTQRSVSAVASPFASVRMQHFARDPANPSRTLVLEEPEPGPLVEVLAQYDVVVNCILQDTDEPLMFVMDEDLDRFAPGTLFVDVVPVELGDVGEQRGAARVPAGRHGRPRGLGGQRDDPSRDRDPRRPHPEPPDPVVPGPVAGLPVRHRLSRRAQRVIVTGTPGPMRCTSQAIVRPSRRTQP
jgi:alanine dehydrogenase